VSLARCNNQQREVRVSSQQRRETRVSKPKCDSCVWPTECELRVFEPCILELRRRDGSQKLKSHQKPETSLFDPLLTDLRDYLTKKRSANQIAPPCRYERLITAMLSECDLLS